MNSSSSRQANDFVGTRSVAAAYWGVHMARAVENLRSLAFVKIAVAKANANLGMPDPERVSSITTDVQALLLPGKLMRPMRLEE